MFLAKVTPTGHVRVYHVNYNGAEPVIFYLVAPLSPMVDCYFRDNDGILAFVNENGEHIEYYWEKNNTYKNPDHGKITLLEMEKFTQNIFYDTSDSIFDAEDICRINYKGYYVPEDGIMLRVYIDDYPPDENDGDCYINCILCRVGDVYMVRRLVFSADYDDVFPVIINKTATTLTKTAQSVININDVTITAIGLIKFDITDGDLLCAIEGAITIAHDPTDFEYDILFNGIRARLLYDRTLELETGAILACDTSHKVNTYGEPIELIQATKTQNGRVKCPNGDVLNYSCRTCYYNCTHSSCLRFYKAGKKYVRNFADLKEISQLSS